jgi:hypothetical protein
MAISVKIWNRVVGYLDWQANRNAAVFKYDLVFLNSGTVKK